MRYPRSVVSIVMLLMVISALSFASDQKDKLRALLADLVTIYKPTKTGMDQTRITEPGTVLLVKKEGIGVNPTALETLTPYKVSGGQITAPKGFLAAMLNSGGSTSTMILKPGDRVYVTDIRVRDTAVTFTVLSCDMSSVTINGNTRQTRYIGHVEFELPAGAPQPVTAATVKAVIDPILATESEATAPKTIELGQTPEQVEEILGKPEKIFKAGPKTIYTYKDVKVVFVDDKVADVQ